MTGRGVVLITLDQAAHLFSAQGMRIWVVCDYVKDSDPQDMICKPLMKKIRSPAYPKNETLEEAGWRSTRALYKGTAGGGAWWRVGGCVGCVGREVCVGCVGCVGRVCVWGSWGPHGGCVWWVCGVWLGAGGLGVGGWVGGGVVFLFFTRCKQLPAFSPVLPVNPLAIFLISMLPNDAQWPSAQPTSFKVLKARLGNQSTRTIDKVQLQSMKWVKFVTIKNVSMRMIQTLVYNISWGQRGGYVAGVWGRVCGGVCCGCVGGCVGGVLRVCGAAP